MYALACRISPGCASPTPRDPQDTNFCPHARSPTKLEFFHATMSTPGGPDDWRTWKSFAQKEFGCCSWVLPLPGGVPQLSSLTFFCGVQRNRNSINARTRRTSKSSKAQELKESGVCIVNPTKVVSSRLSHVSAAGCKGNPSESIRACTPYATYSPKEMWSRDHSGKKKEPKSKLLGPDIFGWGGGLPREGVGAKKFAMSFEAQGNQTFRWDIPGFLPGYPGGARKVWEKQVRVQFLAPNTEQPEEPGASTTMAAQVEVNMRTLQIGGFTYIEQFWGIYFWVTTYFSSNSCALRNHTRKTKFMCIVGGSAVTYKISEVMNLGHYIKSV